MPLVDRSDALAAKITVEKQAQMAQRVLADSFFRTIGVSDQYIPTRDEREALWELAQLDRTNAAVRGKLLKLWLGTADAFMRGEARGGQGFRAATGLNVEYDLLSTSNAAELGDRFAAGLENSQESNSGEVPDLVI